MQQHIQKLINELNNQDFDWTTAELIVKKIKLSLLITKLITL